MNHIERASRIVVDYENLKDTGPPGYNQAVLRDLIVVALREVEFNTLTRRADETRPETQAKRDPGQVW